MFNKFQSGINVMTYTGHGSNNSCSTTGLSSSDVDNMTNYEMLPFIWSVACVNGNFNQGDCFAEAFLRAQTMGNLRGDCNFYVINKPIVESSYGRTR
ncbi:MAG: hypothetical protein IPP29_00990 [Bacteroidetes bacterium]|nr:hypothetical protein [Bacteroidota bacterium]